MKNCKLCSSRRRTKSDVAIPTLSFSICLSLYPAKAMSTVSTAIMGSFERCKLQWSSCLSPSRHQRTQYTRTKELSATGMQAPVFPRKGAGVALAPNASQNTATASPMIKGAQTSRTSLRRFHCSRKCRRFCHHEILLPTIDHIRSKNRQ